MQRRSRVVRSLCVAVLVASIWLPAAAAEPVGFGYAGTASCATFGCHGNPQRGRVEPWRTAYRIWAESDPHSRAGSVLLNERSARIVRRLQDADAVFSSSDTGPSGEDSAAAAVAEQQRYHAILQQRCAGCHVTTGPNAAQTLERGIRRGRPGGVGCESCHGPANGWLKSHATTAWSALDGDRRQKEFGQRNTGALMERAGLCVECHIGPMLSDSGHSFSVDHDLIAAGHPRLSFEFSAALANLPPHWDRKRDRERNGQPFFHHAAWRFGQFQTVARTTLGYQLRQQAENSLLEFSHFDCFSCHGDLAQSLSWRQGGSQGRAGVSNRRDRIAPFPELDKTGSAEIATPVYPGLPSFDDSPFRMLTAIADGMDAHRVAFRQPLERTRRSLAGIWPAAASSWRRFDQRVAGDLAAPARSADWTAGSSGIQGCGELLDSMGRSSQAFAQAIWGEAAIRRLLSDLATNLRRRGTVRWEDGRNLYLAVAALQFDLEEIDSERATSLRSANRQLAELLEPNREQPVSIYSAPPRLDANDPRWHASLLRLEQAIAEFPPQLDEGNTDR